MKHEALVERILLDGVKQVSTSLWTTNSGNTQEQQHQVYLSSNNSTSNNMTAHLLASTKSATSSPTSSPTASQLDSALLFGLPSVNLTNEKFQFPNFRNSWNEILKDFSKDQTDVTEDDEEESSFNPFLDSNQVDDKLSNRLIRLAFGKKQNRIISLIQHYEYMQHGLDRLHWKSFPLFGTQLISLKPPSFLDVTYVDDYLTDLNPIEKVLDKNAHLKLTLRLPINMEHTDDLSKSRIIKAAREIIFLEEVQSKYMSNLFKMLTMSHSDDSKWVLNSITIPMHEKFNISDEYLDQLTKFPVKNLKLVLNFYHPSMPPKYLTSLLESKHITYLEIENLKLTGQLVETMKEKVGIQKISIQPDLHLVAMLAKQPHFIVINGGVSYHNACAESIQKSFPSFLFQTD